MISASNIPVLEKLTTPKAHRVGATEEHIYADNQKARMTAKLVASVLPPSLKKAQEEKNS